MFQQQHPARHAQGAALKARQQGLGVAGAAVHPQGQRAHVAQGQRHGQIGGTGGGALRPAAQPRHRAHLHVAVTGQGHSVAVHHKLRSLRQPAPTGGQSGVGNHRYVGPACTGQGALVGFQQPHRPRPLPVAVTAGERQSVRRKRLAVQAQARIEADQARPQQRRELGRQRLVIGEQQGPVGVFQGAEQVGEPGLRFAALGVCPGEQGFERGG